MIESGLPFVVLKAAISANGKYLAGNGQPRWITGELARNHVQLLRSQFDAIITGSGTILADNPRLNCRLLGMVELSPIKIIIGKTDISKQANIFRGKDCWRFKSNNLKQVLKEIGEKGITRILIEAGPKLSNAFIAENLIDQMIIYRSQTTLNEEKNFLNSKYLSRLFEIGSYEFNHDKMHIYNFFEVNTIINLIYLYYCVNKL